MKHFHLSQGDKLAGLDGPLYLQKKIKSVLTLAPFIGNTCWLVIVLNSVSSRAAPHWAALAFSHWPGMAVEFAENFFPIPELGEGTFLGRAAEEFGGASCLLEESARPAAGGLAASLLPPRPLSPPPRFLSGDWKGSKGPEAQLSPTVSLPPGSFCRKRNKTLGDFPRRA